MVASTDASLGNLFFAGAAVTALVGAAVIVCIHQIQGARLAKARYSTGLFRVEGFLCHLTYPNWRKIPLPFRARLHWIGERLFFGFFLLLFFSHLLFMLF